MKHGEAPWLLMWSSALLFVFGMFWAWLVARCLAHTVAILDISVRSALLVGAGTLGTLLGQLGMLVAWRRYVRATEEALTIDATRCAARRDESKDRAGGAVPSPAGHQDREAQRPGVPPSP